MSFPSLQDMIVSRVYAEHRDEKWGKQVAAVARWVIATDYRRKWYHCGWFNDWQTKGGKIRVMVTEFPSVHTINIFSSPK